MELKSRIRAICLHLGLSIREFERECNLSRGNISNMTGALGSDKISKISARYPFINLYWLLTGDGEMLSGREPALYRGTGRQENPEQQLLRAREEMIEVLREHVRLQNEQIRLLNDTIEQIKNKGKVL